MDKKNLHNIKNSGFKAPQDYFSQVEEQILNGVRLTSKTESSGFEIPDTYFEDVNQKILDTIAQDNDTKVVRLFTWKKTMYAAAIAACLILMFNMFMNPAEKVTINDLINGVETASIEDYLDQEELSSYDLASLLTEDELTSDNFIDNEIPESSIEDYLLENVNLENLIIE